MLTSTLGEFAFDSSNRLISTLTNSSLVTYTYDAEGTRIKSECGEDVIAYTYDVNARLSKLLVKTEGNVTTKYVYGLGLIGEETDEEFKTYHFDLRGSTVAITNEACEVTDTFEYDTYGKVISRTGSSKTPFMYNGRDGVITEDNGLYYMRARYYSPLLKRFINADIKSGSIANAVTLNRYAYANCNPVSNVDPLGLSAEERGSGYRTYTVYASEAMAGRYVNTTTDGPGGRISAADRYNAQRASFLKKSFEPNRFDPKLIDRDTLPINKVEKLYSPYPSSITESTIRESMDKFTFIPADENSEFGYVLYGGDLYTVKYLDYSNNQTYLIGNYNVVAKGRSYEHNFSIIRAITGLKPEGLPEASDRTLYSQNGTRLQSPRIGNNTYASSVITRATAATAALGFLQNGLEGLTLHIDVSVDSSGMDRIAKVYSYNSYMFVGNSDTGIYHTNYIYYGIDENGNMFNVNN